jgi:tRNA A-37 threonylcarbamoyl transferase component Bud32
MPDHGQSVFKCIRRGELAADATRRHDVARQIGRINGMLLAHGYFNRDAKVSNMVVDDKGVVRMIDAGGCRRIGRRSAPDQTLRMLRTLDRSAIAAGRKHGTRSAMITRSDRIRVLEAMLLDRDDRAEGVRSFVGRMAEAATRGSSAP